MVRVVRFSPDDASLPGTLDVIHRLTDHEYGQGTSQIPIPTLPTPQKRPPPSRRYAPSISPGFSYMLLTLKHGDPWIG